MPPLPTTLPVLLLPVRLETHFIDGANGPELWVRIYPDQVAIDTHEAALTAAEQTAGETYWNALWRAGKNALDQEKIAWRQLATAFGPQRAAWIAHLLTPANLDERPAAPTPPNATPQPPPDFPNVATRLNSWERPPLAVGLPDHWTVVTYAQGKETHRVTGSPVRSPLLIGMHPKPALPAEPTALQVDKEMRWMVDFDEAVAAGMAVRIPITQQESSGGFERVVAIGIKAPTGNISGAGVFSLLLHAHRYTDGLAFVPQGAPTNNTPDASSAFSRQDPGYETSFAVERQGPLASDAGCNGRVIAQTLGINPAIFDHVQYAERAEQQNAYQMALALWPGTLGYFLRQMLGNLFTSEQVSLARSYFLAYVRPRGPLPALRVGQTPYGVLPVSSLARWNRAGATPGEQAWISLLRQLFPTWLKGANNTPHVGGSDPDADLVHILGMDASSMAFRGRYAAGANFIWNSMNMLGIAAPEQMLWFNNHAASGRRLLDTLGLNTWDPLVIHTGLHQDSFPVPYPTVQDGPLSETEPLKNDWTMSDGAHSTPGNYINWLRHAHIDDIRNERYPTPAAQPTSLLYRLLRQSVLLEYANLAMDTLVRVGALKLEDTKEVELVNITAPNATVTPWDALSRPAQGVTGPGQTLAQYLETLPPTTQAPYSELTDLRNSLDYLAKLPTAELDRLLTETLDSCSHRLDPWVTSLATRLLEQERQGRSTGPGVYLGGFGWVEGLSRAPIRPPVSGAAQVAVQQLDGVRKARLQLQSEQRPVREPAVNNGGFIHAPSLTQAAVAAVLRNGYLTHKSSTEGQLLALDLSSERVQTALWLLDAVRQGQSLGALLGYRFELGMHSKGLDHYIQDFRNAFPLVANKIPQHVEPGTSVSVESIAATNVVDGLALERAQVNNKLPKGGDWSHNFPALSVALQDQDAIIAIIGDLQDVMDALGDLSIAESVYQVMQGNPVRAGGLLDAVSRGEIPPDPQVVRTPRAGLDVHHRLMVLFPGDVERVNDWQKQDHPRSSAEPRLDDWLSGLLPKPVRVKCQVNYTVPDGHGGVKHETVRITLADLQVDPLDVLAMADAADVAQSSELEQRILYVALAQIPPGASNYQISFERAADWGADDISFPQVLVLARAVRDMVNGARPLVPQDLIEPDRQAEQFGAVVDTGELRSRANAALNALKVAVDDLQNAVNALRTAATQNAQSASDTVREKLISVSWFGVHGSIPLTRQGADAGPSSKLVAQGDAVLKDVRKRYEDAALLNSTIPASDARPADVTTLLQKVFDPSFVALPRFTPPDGNNLENTFSDSHILLANQKQALPRWLQQLTHLRPAVSRFDKAVSLARILIGQDAAGLAAQLPTLTLGQLPYKKLDRWLALPLVPGVPLPPSGSVSLVAWISRDYEEDLPHCGLLLDEWPERIPNPVASTGLSLHYEEPKARAPQTLLLACNPDSASTSWNDDLLLAILNETIDLAKVRTVDLDTIQEVGQILPALYFALNVAQDTISTSFAAIAP